MIRGQRFQIDLDSDEEPSPQPGAFVGDVLEREVTAPLPPSAPKRSNPTGFPGHAKRNIASRSLSEKKSLVHDGAGSKVSVADANETKTSLPTPHSPGASHESGSLHSWGEEERRQIDQENRQKLAEMSPEEIEEERKELLSSLSPTFVQRLLQRSNLKSGSNEVDFSSAHNQDAATEKTLDPPSLKHVSFQEPPATGDARDQDKPMNDNDPGRPTPVLSETSRSADIHFPRPSQPPDLDPSSATFFDDLHSKYFPSLPAEPEKLAWMQPGSAAAAYDADSASVEAKDLRFAFTGALLPPRVAAAIPVTAGLHHHADAPDAAGYTVGELAHLARSTVAAQRCLAFQTLGRVLFRLGKGEFGNPSDDAAAAAAEPAQSERARLAKALWGQMETHGVVDLLVRESEGTGVDGGRHVSARAYATEAVWLWQKGGGRRWKAA